MDRENPDLKRKGLANVNGEHGIHSQFLNSASPETLGKQSDNYYSQLGSKIDNNSAPSIAAQAKRRRDNDFLLLRDYFENNFGLDDLDRTGIFYLYPWSDGRVRSSSPDTRKKKADADTRRPADPDGKRLAVDEDGRRVVVDKDGRIATDAEGRRIVIDDRYRIADGPDGNKVIMGPDGRIMTEADGFRLADGPDGNRIILGPDNTVYGYRVADAGDGSRVIVDPQNRVLNDADGKPIKVNDGPELRITTAEDGTRVAASADGKERIALQSAAPSPALTPEPARAAVDADPTVRPADIAAETPDTQRTAVVEADPALRTAPGDDIETVRTQAVEVAADSPDAQRPVTPDTSADVRVQAPEVPDSILASAFRQADAPDTRPFASFLTQGGQSLESFQETIRNAATSVNTPRAADIGAATGHLDMGTVRRGRFLRMALPTGVDVVVMAGVAGAVAGVNGAHAGIIDRVTGGSNLSAVASAVYAGRDAGLQTLPVYGSYRAFEDGRTAEGWVRVFEDVMDLSPYAFAAAGAVGGAIGTSWTGPGSLGGAAIGGVGGFVVGTVAMLTASEVTRGVMRGIGYDDVDRGMIGSFLAPEYAEEMEGFVRSALNRGNPNGTESWGANESMSEVLERINDNAGSALERAQNLREFMIITNEGINAAQVRNIGTIAERISRDTGITGANNTELVNNIVTAMRIPETRAQLIAFYRQQAEQNPQDQELAGIVSTLTAFEESERQRMNALVGLTGADIMIAREVNEQTAAILRNNGALTLFTGRNAARANPFVAAELASINFAERMRAVQERLSAAGDRSTGDVVQGVFRNGRDAYQEMGTTQALADAYILMMDVEDTLQAKQLEFVNTHWAQLSQLITAGASNRAEWYQFFSSDTTLGDDLQTRLNAARANDPAATELRALMQETNNLQNVTPEQATRLLQNQIFSEAFAEVLADAENDNGLMLAFHDNGFTLRANALQTAREQRTRLEETAARHGYSLSTVTAEELAAGQSLTPDRARALVTETEPERPAMQPH